jgi:hypothetical protein
VRNVLERVGDPADIAAEARERFGIKPAKRSWTDPAAIILLLIGGFTIIGWFVGVVLLWISDTWNTRDKIIGTLVVPGGLAGALGVGLVSSSVQGGSCGPVEVTVAPAPCATAASSVGNVVGLILAVLLLSAPIVTAIYLSLRLRQVRLASDSDEFAAGARDRGSKRLIGGLLIVLLVLAVGTGAAVALFSQTGSDTRRVTEAQIERVNVGDSRDKVAQILGGPDGEGSIVSGLDPKASEEPPNVGEQQFEDCWLYPLTGAGVGVSSDAAVCFDSSGHVVYMRVRIS